MYFPVNTLWLVLPPFINGKYNTPFTDDTKLQQCHVILMTFSYIVTNRSKWRFERKREKKSSAARNAQAGWRPHPMHTTSSCGEIKPFTDLHCLVTIANCYLFHSIVVIHGTEFTTHMLLGDFTISEYQSCWHNSCILLSAAECESKM